MKLQAIALITSITVISLACGRPNPEDYRSQESTATTPAKDNKTADATKKPTTNTMTPANNTPAATPSPTPTPTPSATPAPPAKLAIRTVPNAAEITAAQTQYANANNAMGCVTCHGPIATSTKKGVTVARLGAPAALNQPAHQALLTAKLWPTNTADTTDDGIDTAMLKASAMEAALK